MTRIFLEIKQKFRLLQSRSDFYHKMATIMAAVLKFDLKLPLESEKQLLKKNSLSLENLRHQIHNLFIS